MAASRTQDATEAYAKLLNVRSVLRNADNKHHARMLQTIPPNVPSHVFVVFSSLDRPNLLPNADAAESATPKTRIPEKAGTSMGEPILVSAAIHSHIGAAMPTSREK